MQKQLVVFCAVVAVGLAATGLGRPDPKPDKFKHLEGCYLKELDAVIPLGVSRPINNCVEYRCEKKWIEFVSCGIVSVDPPYKLVEDLSLPYPDCCPKIDKNSIIPRDSKAENTNKL